MITWFARNGVAANLLMISILVAGAFSLRSRLVLEVFPEFTSNRVEISVAYRGATPTEVERGVVIKIEEAIQDLIGVEEITASADEGSARITVEIEADSDPRELLDDIKSRVDAISTFAPDVERPTYALATRRREVIGVVVSGKLAEAELRSLGERVRGELTNLPGVTQVDLTEVRPFEITIEVSEATLQRYGLTFSDVAQAIERSSLDLPAGSLKTGVGEIRLRTVGQVYAGEEFAQIEVIKRADGTRILLGQLARIDDGFDESPIEARFNGERCVLLEVYRVGRQNAIEVATQVKDYVARTQPTLPPGVTLTTWRDRSVIITKRLSTLLTSAAQGGLLVLVVLGLFLRPALAAWVCLGIPVSFMGALIVMPWLGVTINIISVFAFILVLGIVVDDAIVTGENVYEHLRRGAPGETAAIVGTEEVTVPVVFGVLTTVAAFLPVMMMGGERGPIFAQIPLIVIPVLLFSLIESKLVLPSHLKHLRPTDDSGWLARLQGGFAWLLAVGGQRLYAPVLRRVNAHRYTTAAAFVLLLVVIASLVEAGRVRFVFFPRVQSETARASLEMPAGTAFEVTDRHIERMAAAAEVLRKKYIDPASGQPVISNVLATSGSAGGNRGRSHVGQVMFEITPPEDRSLQITSSELVSEWRALIGPIPGAKELSFVAELGRGGDPIDVRLSGEDLDRLRDYARQTREWLATKAGVFDIADSFDEGQQELRVRLKPGAAALGISLAELGGQVRQGFFGAQAQRIQRGRDDLRVMVRYPREQRRTLGHLEAMHVRTASGAEVPFSVVAEATLTTGLPAITRIDRRRTVSVTADLDKDTADGAAINAELKRFLDELLAGDPATRHAFAGEERDRSESLTNLLLGVGLVLFAIYGLLAVPLKSYLQPLLVMSVIPFGWACAVVGHLLMGMSLSFFSLLGMLALTGVVVNDSLVLVDFINRARAQGASVADAVASAGVARLRAILLTSLTTFAGLMPLIFERSTQAQFLIPMAVSLGFGVLFATFVTLLLVPALYLMLDDLIAAARAAKAALWDMA